MVKITSKSLTSALLISSTKFTKGGLLNHLDEDTRNSGILKGGYLDLENNVDKVSQQAQVNPINRLFKRKRRMIELSNTRRKRALGNDDTNANDQEITQSRQKRQIFSLTELATSLEERTQLEQKVQKIEDHWSSQFQELEDLIGTDQLTTDPELFENFLARADNQFARAASTLHLSKSPLLKLLNPYGCHCNFEIIPSPFMGEPVNEFDAACKVLQDGYRCIGVDNGQECANNAEDHMTIPKYMRQHDKNKLIDGLEGYCQQANGGDTCGYNLCMVETYFVNTIFNLLQSGKRIDIKKSHRMGFDPMQECQVRPSQVLPISSNDYSDDYYYYEDYDSEHSAFPKINKSQQFKENLDSIAPNKKNKKKENTKFVPDQCCGVFPERKPFNPGSAGQKECCEKDRVATVFSTITHMCCSDGSAMKLGEC